MRTPPPPPSDSLSPVLVDSTKKPHKHGSLKNRLISTQKDANASIVVIVMTTKHSDDERQILKNIKQRKCSGLDPTWAGIADSLGWFVSEEIIIFAQLHSSLPLLSPGLSVCLSAILTIPSGLSLLKIPSKSLIYVSGVT